VTRDFDSIAHAHRELIDQLVEEDESLLARYLEEGKDPSAADLHAPFEKALREGHLVPILFTSARTGAGIGELLHVLASLAPNPAEGNPPPFFKGEPGGRGEAFAAVPDAASMCWHTSSRSLPIPTWARSGSSACIRARSGRTASSSSATARSRSRSATSTSCRARTMSRSTALMPGDIGAIAKVEEIDFDSVLHDSHDEDHIHLKPLEFPRPMQGLAVETRKKGDEQRLFDILHKLELEDPCFEVERHPTTHETVIRGLGEMHLRYKLEKMATQFKLELDTRPPLIPYRETVTANADGHCRHKKQSGGAGQFGEVYLKIEPLQRGAGFEFVDHVKGGVIPGVFMASVEKGVHQALSDGVIAGFPVQDIRVIVYDGKTHAVDGKDIAFVTAGRKATVEAIRAAESDRAGAHRQHRGRRPRGGDRRPDRRPVEPARPHHRHQPASGQYGLDHRRSAAGRDHRLRLAPEVDDRRPGHPTTSSSSAMRKCRRKCSRSWRPRSGRRKRKIERDVIWLEPVALRPSPFD
jgi:elongation factor G